MYSQATKYQYRQLAIQRGKRYTYKARLIATVKHLFSASIYEYLMGLFLGLFIVAYFLY